MGKGGKTERAIAACVMHRRSGRGMMTVTGAKSGRDAQPNRTDDERTDSQDGKLARPERYGGGEDKAYQEACQCAQVASGKQ